jgi:hypothetical protein
MIGHETTKTSQEYDSFVNRSGINIEDEASYNNAINQLINRHVDRDSQLLIRAIINLFSKLYNSPKPAELIRLCE